MKKIFTLITLLTILFINIVSVNAEEYHYGLMYKKPADIGDFDDIVDYNTAQILNGAPFLPTIAEALGLETEVIIKLFGLNNPTYYWTPINEQKNQYTINDWYANEYVLTVNGAGKVTLNENNLFYGTGVNYGLRYTLNQLFGVRNTSGSMGPFEEIVGYGLDTSLNPQDKKDYINVDTTSVENFYSKYSTLPETLFVCYEYDYDQQKGVLIFYPAIDKVNINYDKYVNSFSAWAAGVTYPFKLGKLKANYISVPWINLKTPVCNFVARHPDTKLACSLVSEYEGILKYSIDKYGCSSQQFNQHYIEFKTYCDNYKKNNNADECSDICDKFRDEYVKICGEQLPDLKCGSLGTNLVGWLMKILKIIRYIVPVLVIVLSVIDYVQAIGASDDEALKKASGKFIKRIIAAVLIFLLPVILQFLFDIFKIKGLDSNDPFCMK